MPMHMARMMKGEAKLTIGRTKGDKIVIEVRDANRKKDIAYITMDAEKFALALTGLARQEGKLEYNLDYDPMESFEYVEEDEG